MSTFLERLQEEEKDLSIKIEKLNDFINNNPAFETVGEIQKVLLVQQLNCMKLYLYTLQGRIYDLNK